MPIATKSKVVRPRGSSPPTKLELPKDTIADLLRELGDIPPDRVLRRPAPGTATEADLLRLADHEDRLCELVDGVLVEKGMSHKASRLAMWLGAELTLFVKRHKLGRVAGPDAGHRLLKGIVRMPDLAYISFKRVPKDATDDTPIVSWIPNLAVEVLSESNTAAEMKRKRREYFKAGVQLVWIADPEKRTVAVYHSTKDVRVLTEDDFLGGEDVLPGFRYSIREWMDCP